MDSRVAAAGRAVAAPFVFTGRMMAATGAAVVRTSRAVFSRAQSAWQMLYARTRIDYRLEAGDPTANSAVVATVSWIARNFPDAPVVITRHETDESFTTIGPGPVGPGRMLRLLEKPNGWFSGVLQWMATIVEVFTLGNGYWVKIRDRDGISVVALWWVPASTMEPRWPDVPGNDVFISHYEQTIDGIVYGWRPEDVVHFRYGIDPTNPRKGRSPLYSLLREIFTDNEASAFTANLLRNLAVPGVIIAPANTNTGPTVKDPEGIKSKFKDTFGGDRQGDPMVLTSPTEVKVLSWSPEQMNLRELRKIPEERVTAVLGVAAIVAGLGAGLDRSTFSNFGEARRAAYTESIIPIQRLMSADLEVQLLPDFPDMPILGQTATSSLDVAFDWTKATAMQESAADIWRRFESAAKGGLVTRADFKKAVGLPVMPGDDIYLIANNYTTVPAGGNQPPSGLLLPPGTEPGRIPAQTGAPS